MYPHVEQCRMCPTSCSGMLSLLEDSSLDPLRPHHMCRLVKTYRYAVPASRVMTHITSPRGGESTKQASQGTCYHIRGDVLRRL